MKKLFYTTFVLLSFGAYSHAQNVGIGTPTPNASAKLEITDANRGVLIPRIALTATNAAAPVTAPATSLLVYNTATSGTIPNNVTPGYYYWDGVMWVRLLNAESSDWKLTGNAGTVAATNFIGTTDAIDFVTRTSNLERMRVNAAGNVGIGTAAPASKLEVSSGALADAIFGHSNNVGGYLGRETNITFGTPLQTLQGAGVYANNPASGYTSSFSQSSGLADVAAAIAFSSVWIASYNYVENIATSTFNPPGLYSQLNNSSTTLTGYQTAVRGYSNRGTATGNPGYTVGGQFTSNAQSQDGLGVVGQSFTNTTYSVGGYFTGNNYAGTNIAYAYVGGNVGALARKITGTGTVAEIVPTENHGRVTLVCPESPEYWYQDYGTINLVNGRAHVELDPILADIIIVDSKNPIRAFFTPNNMLNYNGVAITNQTANGFDVVELNGGTNSGELHYQIVVKPKTNYGEGRFVQAPGPAYLKTDKEPAAAKAKNQVNPEAIYRWPADHVVYKYNPEDHIPVGEVIPAGPNAGKVKLGNGKYGEGLPAQNPSTEK